MSEITRIKVARFVEHRRGKTVGRDFSQFQFSLNDFPRDKIPKPNSLEWNRIRWSRAYLVGGKKFKSLIREDKIDLDLFPHFRYQNGKVLYDKSFAKRDGLQIKRNYKDFNFKINDLVSFKVKFYVLSDDKKYLENQKYRDDKYSDQRIPFKKNVFLIPVLHRYFFITTTAEKIRHKILKHQLPLKFANQKVYDDFWSLINNKDTTVKASGNFELDKGTFDSIRDHIYAYVSDFSQSKMGSSNPLSYLSGVANDTYIMNVRGWKLSFDLAKQGICKFYSSDDDFSTFPKGGCVYILLYYVFCNAIAKQYRDAQKKKTTNIKNFKEGKYENFCISKIYRIIHNTDIVPDYDDYDKWGLSFDDVKRFLKYYNSEGAVWDGFGKCREYFNLGNGSIHMPKFHYVYANQHAFLIENNGDTIFKEVSQILERISLKLDIDVSINYENEWDRFKLAISSKENDEYLFTDDLDEMVMYLGQDIENSTHIMTNLDLADVFLDLWKKFGIKTSIDSRGQSISGLHILANNCKKYFFIKNQFSASAGQTIISSIEEYSLFRHYFNKVKHTLLHTRYLSVYSLQVRKIVQNFKKGGLKCCFDWDLYNEPMIIEDDGYVFNEDNNVVVGASDINRFYLSEFLKLEYLPVFNIDCFFIDYDQSPLEDYTIYIVEKIGDVFEYPYYRQDLCYGLQLRKINHQRFVIKKMMRPAHLEENILKVLFEEIYSSDLSDSFKKDIGNILLGFLLQKNKNMHKTYHTIDLKEAEGFRRSIGGHYFEFFHRGDSHGFIFNKCFQSKLVDGFYFIGLLYLDASHFTMYELIQRMMECHLEPFAINVDCVYHNQLKDSDEYRLFQQKYPQYFDYQDKNHFNALGKLKYDESKSNVWSEYKIKTFNFNFSLPSQNIISMNTESIQEMTSIIQNIKRLFVFGQGGMGKSYTILKALENIVDKKRILILTKSWKLTDNWIAQQYASQTIDGFFHYQPNRYTPTSFIRMDDLLTFDAIVIDDMFLNGIHIWHSVFLLMEQFPDKIIIGNGDPYQLDGVFDVFFNAFDGNREKKMIQLASNLFTNIIELKENKRLTLDSDRLVYQQLISIIKSDVTKDIQYIKLCDWVQNHCSIIYDYRQIPESIKTIITANNNQRNLWNNKIFNQIYPKDEWYTIGHTIMYDRGQADKKGLRFGRFQEFHILELQDDYVKLKNRRTKNIIEIEDDNMIDWISSRFTYPFGFTCHSWQGSTIKEKLLIDGFFDSWITNKWRFTALTRNTSFADIFVFFKKSDEFINNIQFYNKLIKSHLDADRKKFAVIDMDRYIDVEWYANQIHNIRVNNLVCSCGGFPNSCDRIQSHLPHYKSNSRFICLDCNRSKRHFN